MKKNTRILAATALLLATPAFQHHAAAVGTDGLIPDFKVAKQTHATNDKALEPFRKHFEESRKLDLEIRAEMHEMREETKSLRKLVRESGDLKLKEQLEKDLTAFHDKLREAHRLHKTNESLTKQIQTARHNGDLAKLRELAPKLVANKTRQLELIRSAHQDLLSEHTKIQEKLR